ncbi:MAG: GFA family protein [Hyphomonadaceae bacterium]|nr:GFA family protein [Hyphomonadaceae bacterium]
MRLEGGCYCGKLRFSAEGEPILRAQCHCRECQYISGGAPNMFLLMPPDGFKYTAGAPKAYRRSDIENAVTREFCAECGTHITTRRPGLAYIILKAGVLDEPARFGLPQMAIFTCDKQPFHQIAEGVAQFEGLPPQRG